MGCDYRKMAGWLAGRGGRDRFSNYADLLWLSKGTGGLTFQVILMRAL